MPEKKNAKKVAPKAKAKAASKAKPKAEPKTAPAAKTKAAAKKEEPKTQKFFRTGEICPQSGLYMHLCVGKAGEKNTIPLSKTETFPPCRSCGSVKWVLVMAA